MKQHVALFGASFNPPTGDTGHGGIVASLCQLFPQVWVLPVFQHPLLYKRNTVQQTSYEDRLNMVQLQFGSIPNVRIIEAERELFQRRLRLIGDEASFGTADLLEYLREIYPTYIFHLVLGGDTVVDLVQGKWRRSTELMETTPIVAIQRLGVSLFVDEETLTRFKSGLNCIVIPGLDGVSSSRVRRLIIQDGLGADVDQLVDTRVLDYIQTHHLYSGNKILI